MKHRTMVIAVALVFVVAASLLGVYYWRRNAQQTIVRSVLDKHRNEAFLCDAAVTEGSRALSGAFDGWKSGNPDLAGRRMAEVRLFQARAKRLCEPFKSAIVRECEAAGVSDASLIQQVKDEWQKQNARSPSAQRAHIMVILDQHYYLFTGFPSPCGCCDRLDGRTVSRGLESIKAGQAVATDESSNRCIKEASGVLDHIEKSEVGDRAFVYAVWDEYLQEHVSWPQEKPDTGAIGGVPGGVGGLPFPTFVPLAPNSKGFWSPYSEE